MNEFEVQPFPATIEDIRERSRVAGRALWQILLDRSVFAPGQRGTLEAESRSGARLVVAVMEVLRDQHGDLWHLVDKPLAAGTRVGCRVEESAGG